ARSFLEQLEARVGREGAILASEFCKRCKRYWAQEQEPLQIGLFCITLAKEKWLNADMMLRTLKFTFQKECRSVYQLQYISPDHILAMVEEARHLQGSGLGPLCVHCCGRTGVLCTMDYVRQLLLTQTIPLNFSFFDLVLQMRKQRPAAVQTEMRGSVSAVWPVSSKASWPSPPGLLAIPHPRGRLLRYLDISVPVAPAPAMADTYAAVQKRGAPAGARPGSRARSAEEAPVYSQVTPRAQRPGTHAEDTRTALPGCVPADQSPAGSGAYEDVTDGAQTSGLGFNLRIGRPKGPRDPPADWSQV
uniref:protein-tyrosine-phosphatase n=1 Tax=Microcebus murinus TaxID=30608 RepID=A0A8C5XDB2_MICMU